MLSGSSAVPAAALWRPARPVRALLYDAALIVGGSLLVAALAQVAIPLPFTPVPLTGQTLGVLLVGFLLGRTRGAASIIVYLAEGAVGLPVFAQGSSGLARLAGPTGGYLLGFVLAAAMTGWLAEQGWDRRPATTALAMLSGTAIIYLCGLLWLVRFVGPERVLALGLFPFLAGDLVKAALAAALLPAGWRRLRRLRPLDP